MSSFSDENIAKAIQRVPATSTKDLLNLMAVAKVQDIPSLQEAIEAELAIRGPMKFDKVSAEQHAAWADQIGESNVQEAILTAFRKLPINEDERGLTVRIAQNPGISYSDLVSFRRKGDVGLILGHMIYERHGFFRKFLNGTEPMSGILFERDDAGGKTHYRLTPAAHQAFAELEVI